MIIEEIKNIKSGKSELQKFGITMGIVFVLFGGFSWWRGKDYYSYFLIVSTVFLTLSVVGLFLLKPIHKVWMSLAVLMSWFMTRIILSILFYFGFTPIGFIARLFGKDFLRLKFNKNAVQSYWIPKERLTFEKNEYERQF